MTTPCCSVCGYPFPEHSGADCSPAPHEDTRAALELDRLRAKHRRFADVTNQMLTELHQENARLRAELDRQDGGTQ